MDFKALMSKIKKPWFTKAFSNGLVNLILVVPAFTISFAEASITKVSTLIALLRSPFVSGL